MARNRAIQLIGTEDLARKLGKLADTMTARATIEAAMEPGAARIRDRARANAPTGDEPVVRKRLKEGIVYRETTKRDQRLFNIGLGFRIAPIREVAHATLVEFGSGPRVSKKTGRALGSMPATPFLRPAFDAEQESIVRDVRAALLAEIRKVSE